MNFERNDYYRDVTPIHDDCKKAMYYHIILKMKDGSTVDGIIENVDEDGIDMLVGEDVMEQDDEGQYDEERQFYGYGHGRPRRRFRRFRRRRFPLASLLALSLLPYPHIPPFYPYW